MNLLENMIFVNKSEQSLFFEVFIHSCFYICFWMTAILPFKIDIVCWVQILLATPSVMLIVMLSITLPRRYKDSVRYWNNTILLFYVPQCNKTAMECKGLNELINHIQKLESKDNLVIHCAIDIHNGYMTWCERLFVKLSLPSNVRLKDHTVEKSIYLNHYGFIIEKLSNSQCLLSSL